MSESGFVNNFQPTSNQQIRTTKSPSVQNSPEITSDGHYKIRNRSVSTSSIERKNPSIPVSPKRTSSAGNPTALATSSQRWATSLASPPPSSLPVPSFLGTSTPKRSLSPDETSNFTLSTEKNLNSTLSNSVTKPVLVLQQNSSPNLSTSSNSTFSPADSQGSENNRNTTSNNMKKSTNENGNSQKNKLKENANGNEKRKIARKLDFDSVSPTKKSNTQNREDSRTNNINNSVNNNSEKTPIVNVKTKPSNRNANSSEDKKEKKVRLLTRSSGSLPAKPSSVTASPSSAPSATAATATTSTVSAVTSSPVAAPSSSATASPVSGSMPSSSSPAKSRSSAVSAATTASPVSSATSNVPDPPPSSAPVSPHVKHQALDMSMSYMPRQFMGNDHHNYGNGPFYMDPTFVMYPSMLGPHSHHPHGHSSHQQAPPSAYHMPVHVYGNGFGSPIMGMNGPIAAGHPPFHGMNPRVVNAGMSQDIMNQMTNDIKRVLNINGTALTNVS